MYETSLGKSLLRMAFALMAGASLFGMA